jgi:DNA mismatch repair protein MutS
VVRRAREILSSLEHDELARGGRPSLSGTAAAPQQQLGLFQVSNESDEKLKERLREVDINRTTPLEALQLLAELKKDIE